MPKRLVIVGGVAAGASAAAKARRSNEEIEIVMFESGPYMSFANCGLPYYVGGEIAERRSLFVADPRNFKKRFRVDVRLETTVTGVDPAAREVTFRTEAGHEDRLSYDRLILGTGTVPFRLPLEGIDAPNIFECRTVPDVDAILALLRELQQPLQITPDTASAGTGTRGRALVIGAGYIGLECAEQFLNRGLEVAVVEALDQIMGPLDHEMTLPALDALRMPCERPGSVSCCPTWSRDSITPEPDLRHCSEAGIKSSSTWPWSEWGFGPMWSWPNQPGCGWVRAAPLPWTGSSGLLIPIFLQRGTTARRNSSPRAGG